MQYFKKLMQNPWSILDPAQCWGVGHYPRTGVRGGGVVPSPDFLRLAGMCYVSFQYLTICCRKMSFEFFLTVFSLIFTFRAEEYHDIAMSLCGELKNGKVSLGKFARSFYDSFIPV